MKQDPKIGITRGGVVTASEKENKKKQHYNPDVFNWLREQEDKYIGGYNRSLFGQWQNNDQIKIAENEITKRIVETPNEYRDVYKSLLIDPEASFDEKNINKASEEFRELVNKYVKVLQSREAAQSIESLRNTYIRLNEEYENLETQIEADSTVKLTALKNAEKAVKAIVDNAQSKNEKITADQQLWASQSIFAGGLVEADKMILDIKEKLKSKRLESLSAELRIEEQFRQAADEIGKNTSYIVNSLETSAENAINNIKNQFNATVAEKEKVDPNFKSTGEYAKLLTAMNSEIGKIKNNLATHIPKLVQGQSDLLQLNKEAEEKKRNEKADSAIKSLEETLKRQQEEFSEMRSAYKEDITSKFSSIISANKTASVALSDIGNPTDSAKA